MALNMENIRLAQQKNKSILARVKKCWSDEFDKFQENFGLTLGYIPGPVEGMEWLGVGELSSPRRHDPSQCHFPFLAEAGDELTNNGAHFPAYQSISRPAYLNRKCPINVQNSEDQAWIQRIWDNELRFIFVHESKCREGASFELIIATREHEALVQYRGFPRETGRREAIFQNFPRGDLNQEDQVLLMFRTMHNFLRNYAYMLPPYHLWDLIQHYLKRCSPLTSKKHRADYLDWVILETDLLLNIPYDFDNYSDENLKIEIHNALINVGSALSALKRFE
jgi:hypothetical protein